LPWVEALHRPSCRYSQASAYWRPFTGASRPRQRSRRIWVPASRRIPFLMCASLVNSHNCKLSETCWMRTQTLRSCPSNESTASSSLFRVNSSPKISDESFGDSPRGQGSGALATSTGGANALHTRFLRNSLNQCLRGRAKGSISCGALSDSELLYFLSARSSAYHLWDRRCTTSKCLQLKRS